MPRRAHGASDSLIAVPDRSGQRLSRARLAEPFAVAWLLVAACLAVGAAWLAIALRGQVERDPFQIVRVVDPGGAGVRFNLAAFGLAMALSLAVGLVHPGWWRRAVALLAALPVPVVLVTSDAVRAGLAVLALLFPAVWLGRDLAGRLLRAADPGLGWAVGAAFGLGIIATLGLALGLAGCLRPAVVWPVLVSIALGLLVRARDRLRRDILALGVWVRRPVTRRPAHFLLAGAALGFLWLNLLGAVAPEIYSDATNHRVAAAAGFARAGRLATGDPDLAIEKTPATGEIIYAVALTVGPLQTTKLLHFLAGLLCAAAISVLGTRLGGRRAGGIAAFAFYTMPLVAWLSQTAYLDLFITLFAAVAALALVCRSRPDWRGGVVAGVCLGLGVGVKLHFGYVAVGLAATAALLSWRRGSPGAAARVVAIVAIGAAAAFAPYLVRSAVLSGEIPGLALATQSISRAPGERPSSLDVLPLFGFGRSPGDLLRAPLDVTLRSQRFSGDPTKTPYWQYGGHIGFLLLGLLPLLLVARRRRAAVALLAGAALAFVLWFYTAQFLRYALPILALLCPVAGAAFVSARRRIEGRMGRAVMTGLLLILVAAGVAVEVKEPNATRDVALGRQDRDAYLAEHLFFGGSYTALRLLNADPDATRAFTIPDHARLYSGVRLSSPSTTGRPVAINADEGTVLARLQEGGYSHIVLDRRYPWDLDGITVASEEFLRRNTALVGGGGGGNAYVYRLLPADQRGGQRPWAQGRELLPDGGFEAAEGVLPAGWVPIGNPRYDTSGAAAHTGRGAVLTTPHGRFVTTTAVVPRVQYLLSGAARGVGDDRKARLHLVWQDRDGRAIGSALETVWLSPRAYHTFSMLATAPPDVATAMVQLEAEEGEVWFDDVSLRSVAPE